MGEKDDKEKQTTLLAVASECAKEVKDSDTIVNDWLAPVVSPSLNGVKEEVTAENEVRKSPEPAPPQISTPIEEPTPVKVQPPSNSPTPEKKTKKKSKEGKEKKEKKKKS